MTCLFWQQSTSNVWDGVGSFLLSAGCFRSTKRPDRSVLWGSVGWLSCFGLFRLRLFLFSSSVHHFLCHFKLALARLAVGFGRRGIFSHSNVMLARLVGGLFGLDCVLWAHLLFCAGYLHFLSTKAFGCFESVHWRIVRDAKFAVVADSFPDRVGAFWA